MNAFRPGQNPSLANPSRAVPGMDFPTQREFTLSGPQSENAGIEGFLEFALRSVHEQPDEVNSVFFSKANMDYLQDRIRTDVRKLTGITIGRQGDEDLAQIMIGLYAMEGGSSCNARNKVARLNNLVLRVCVKQCVEGAQAYSGYVHDASRSVTPIAHPVNPSGTGTDTLRGFPY